MAHDNTLYADSRTIALSPLTKHGLHLWKLVVGDTWHITAGRDDDIQVLLDGEGGSNNG